MTLFYDWLIAKYRKKDGSFKDNRFGDLAADAFNDPFFPRDAVIGQPVLDYLRRCGACKECIETFKDAWRKYRNWE